MEEEITGMNGYVKNNEDKWILTPEAKAASTAQYYSHRLAYDPVDRKHVIGTYTPTGEVVLFSKWHVSTPENRK
jgi:hypothetical protein